MQNILEVWRIYKFGEYLKLLILIYKNARKTWIVDGEIWFINGYFLLNNHDCSSKHSKYNMGCFKADTMTDFMFYDLTYKSSLFLWLIKMMCSHSYDLKIKCYLNIDLSLWL